jgi:hypothetical protein
MVLQWSLRITFFIWQLISNRGHDSTQLEKPAEYKQYEMELFFWNYKFAFGIFSSSSKHQEYLDFCTPI